MAKKRKAFVHIGLDDGSGDFVESALETHRSALLELGVRRPSSSREEMFRAAIELMRSHQEWGYQRAEVEGAWSKICRRAEKGKETIIVSQPLLAAAEPEQIALLVDGLAGFEVHVVVTVQAPDAWSAPGDPGRDLGPVLERWAAAVRKPERLHVLVGDERTTTWKALGKVVGFGTASLAVLGVPVPPRARLPRLAPASRATVLRVLGEGWVELLGHGEHDVRGDVTALVPEVDDAPTPSEAQGADARHALDEALHEIERLTRRNETLEVQLDQLDRKRKKLKRRLSEVA